MFFHLWVKVILFFLLSSSDKRTKKWKRDTIHTKPRGKYDLLKNILVQEKVPLRKNVCFQSTWETKNVLKQPQIKADTVYAEFEGCGKKSATCEFWKYFARLIVCYGSRKEIRHTIFFVSSVNLNGKETVSEKVQWNVVTKCLFSFYRQIELSWYICFLCLSNAFVKMSEHILGIHFK